MIESNVFGGKISIQLGFEIKKLIKEFWKS